MKTIRFSDEAERLNVPLEDVKRAFRKSVREGKIHGMIVAADEEIINYTLDERKTLAERLSSGKVSVNNLAEEWKLKAGQLSLVINDLLAQNAIEGALTYDGVFVSRRTMREMIAEMVEKDKTIDVQEISNRLLVPEKDINLVIENAREQIINTISPYQQIRIADLSKELNMPESFTATLLKTLISKGKLAGSLDMVNQTLIIERAKISKTLRSSETSSENITKAVHGKPSSAWYLAPLFLGLIGGLIGYTAVKDEDKSMADNLLNLGIAITVIGVLIVLAEYFWIWSILQRFFR